MKKGIGIYIVIFLIFLLVISLPIFVFLEKRNVAEQNFISISNEKSVNLEKSFESLIIDIESLVNFFNASDFVTQEEFTLFANNIAGHSDVELMWAPKINNDTINVLNHSIYMTHSHPDFEFKKVEIGDYDNRDFEDLYPVSYTSINVTEDVIGQNLSGNRDFYQAVKDFEHGKKAVFLFSQRENGVAYIVMPVFSKFEEVAAVGKRDLKGIILAKVNFIDFFNGITSEYRELLLQVTVQGEFPEMGVSLYKNGTLQELSGIYKILDDVIYLSKTIEFLDKKFLIKIYPSNSSFGIGYEEFYTILFLSMLVFLISLKFYMSEVNRAATIKSQMELLEDKEKALSFANEELYKRVDELVFARNELEKSYREIENARDEAEEASRAKTEFLANMSHELRTPMHSIINYSEMGMKKLSDNSYERLDKYFTNINKSGQRLLKIINDLLDLSKLEAKAVLLEPRKSDMNEIIVDVLNELYALLNEKQIKVSVEVDAISTYAICDREKIFHVLMNLLSNAIKFSLEDSMISIVVQDDTLGYDDGKYKAISMSVIDSGIGLPDDELEAVFDKFYQSSKTQTGAGGTGLGLSICKEVIVAHRGSIWAANNRGGGARFTFVLPRDFLG